MKRFLVVTAFCSVLATVSHAAKFQVGPYCMPDDPDPASCIAKLVHYWEHRDGAGFWEVGSALSESFCVHPRKVLLALSGKRINLDSWTEDLPFHTFVVYDHADTEFGVSATAHLIDLKACMVSQANRYLEDPDVGEAAEHLLAVLNQTEVAYID